MFEFVTKGAEKRSAYLIAEIGNNHNGSMRLAKELVVEAKNAGVDCVKFQLRDLPSLYRVKSLTSSGDDLGTEYIIDLLKKYDFSVEQHRELFDFCSKLGIDYLCTPWDLQSVKNLEEFGVWGYKVASADFTNFSLLAELSNTCKPLILSTGMSSSIEIKRTIEFLNQKETRFVLLHCNSTYPAPVHDLNINFIKALKNWHSYIGYSGHERGFIPSLGAVALGAVIIERHITIDRNMEGPDHAASLTIPEFKLFVESCRELEAAMGSSSEERYFSQGEKINRDNLAKSLVAARAIQKGEVIRDSDVMVKSPGQGISPAYLDELVGKTLNRSMGKEDYFYLSDLESDVEKVSLDFKFTRPWGIPVRYHDYLEFRNLVIPDIWEFHFSYEDMNKDPSKYFDCIYEENFLVHAPELFSNSHLMDLASMDIGYREKSIEETQKIIEITKSLKSFFPNTVRPKIVANVGGFSMDKPLNEEEKILRYEILEMSLNQLDCAGVELIPQTMAPFPWHFGGQRFQNLFLTLEDLLFWGKRLNLRYCFDVSHSYLACNHMREDFYSFAKKISPLVAHVHLGDGVGLNGEGIQLGEGEIDFVKLNKILRKGCPEASFIPEIWQGHKNNGAGFWTALNLLKKLDF